MNTDMLIGMLFGGAEALVIYFGVTTWKYGHGEVLRWVDKGER